VHFGKVALLSGMLVVGSIMVVVVQFASSSTVVVTAFERWVSAFGAVVIAFEIEGTAFALASMVSSSAVA
jgi:hypothetical protein